MIERYTRKEMAKIWEPENRFRIWLEIETLACEKQADLGVIPAEAVKVIREKERMRPGVKEIRSRQRASRWCLKDASCSRRCRSRKTS